MDETVIGKDGSYSLWEDESVQLTIVTDYSSVTVDWSMDVINTFEDQHGTRMVRLFPRSQFSCEERPRAPDNKSEIVGDFFTITP